MNARDAMRIAEAAVRWNAAREHRLAVGAVKRRLDKAAKGSGRWTPQQLTTDRLLTLAKRQELAAARALAKSCPQARTPLEMADVVEYLPMEPTE